MGTNTFDSSATSASLLIRLRDTGDHQAWEQFHQRYGPMIRAWCRQWFPRETDDMVQEVLLRLTKCLKEFEYQPNKGRFRGYLKTVTQRLMSDLKDRAARLPVTDGDCELLPDQLQAPQDLMDRLAAEFDLELLEQAKERVRGRIEDQTWRVYEETAERFRDSAEVANELGMKVGAVYQAKHRVMTELRREIEMHESLA